MERPLLWNMEKREPLYALNNLPKSFAYALGREKLLERKGYEDSWIKIVPK